MEANDMTVRCGDGVINIRVGAILEQSGKLLMVRAPGGGPLYTVGGRLKFGETAEQAVLREVREELGTELSVGQLLFVHELYFSGSVPPIKAGRDVYEIGFYFEMKLPEDFVLPREEFCDGGAFAKLVWTDLADGEPCYPIFLKEEMRKRRSGKEPSSGVKHFVTDERKSKEK